jgi:chaperonin GroEL
MVQARTLQRAARTYASRAGKDIHFGDDARQSILDGVQHICRAVSATLGPKGRNVIIEQAYGAPKITKDGVTVAKAIEFADHGKNLGAQLIRQVASNANDEAGDGTTTSSLLAYAIYSEGCKSVRRGVGSVEVKRGIDLAVEKVVEHLHSQTRKISSKEEITQVATISANGDKAIGQIIADAMEKVGKEGVITTADGKTTETELTVVEGMSLDRGFISPYFVTNTKDQTVEMEDAFVLVCRKAVGSITQVMPALEHVVKHGNKPFLIIADDVDGEALAVLIINKMQGRLKVCAVKAPGFGDNKVAYMHDLAIFTGAQVINDDTGITLEKFDPAYLGRAGKVTITKDQTILLTGAGAAADVKDRVEEIKEQITQTTSDYEREKMQERLGKLAGGVAVIKVGGNSDVEVAEKKDRFEDALNATKAAVAEGIVAGGGSALLFASTVLEPLLQDPTLSVDIKTGVRIVFHAVRQPCQKIVDNAGLEGAVVLDTLLKQPSAAMGFDAASNQYVNMFEAGIIDPTKVVRTALVDAASVAGLMITTEATIVTAEEDDEEGIVKKGK